MFRCDDHILEFAAIDKRDGKDIICAPTSTFCGLGCKFCFLSDFNMKSDPISAETLCEGIDYVITHTFSDSTHPTLLISFMGCGEPLLNYRNVLQAASQIRDAWRLEYPTVRFAIASLMPSRNSMYNVTKEIKRLGLQVKFHLSLHSPFDAVRERLMPAAIDVAPSLKLLRKYKEITGNSTEIHTSTIFEA